MPSPKLCLNNNGILLYRTKSDIDLEIAQGCYAGKSATFQTQDTGLTYYISSSGAYQSVGSSSGLALTTGNTLAVAVANTTAIQAALTAGGIVSITIPGTYLVNFGLILPNFAEIYLADGVVLQQPSGNVASWFAATSEYNQTAVTTTGGIVSSWYGGAALANGTSGSWNIGTITFSGAVPTNIANGTAKYLQLAPGLTVASGIAGDVTGLYDGVFPIIPGSYNSGAQTVQFILRADNGGDVLAPSFVGSILVSSANSNIRIYGKGTIDFNVQNVITGSPLLNGSGIIFNKVANSIIEDITFNNCNENIVQGANMYNCKFRGIIAEQANGGIQFSGHARDIEVSGWGGSFDDDPIAYMNSTGDTKLPLDGTGSLNGLIVKNNHFKSLGSRLVLLVSSTTVCDPSGIGINNVVIEDNSTIYGQPYLEMQGGNGISLETGGIINNLSVRNHRGNGTLQVSQATQITFQGSIIYDNIAFNKALQPKSGANAGVLVINSNVVLPTFTLKNTNIKLDSSLGQVGVIFTRLGNNTIGDINLESCNIGTVNANTFGSTILYASGNTGNTWGSLNINGGSTSGAIQYLDAGNGTPDVNITGNHRWGTTVNSIRPSVTYRFNGMVVTQAATNTGTFLLYGSGTFNLNFKDIQYKSTNGPFIYAQGGAGLTANINIDGLNGNPTGYALLSANGQSGISTWNVTVQNVSNNTRTGFTNTSGFAATVNWNNPDGSLPVDMTLIAKTNVGAWATPIAAVGTIPLKRACVSDGTNFRDIVNPTSNFY